MVIIGASQALDPGSIPGRRIAAFWGISSIGRVRALQARGTGIETPMLQAVFFFFSKNFGRTRAEAKMTGVGFEPTPPKRLVPETSALDRSAIQPMRWCTACGFVINAATKNKNAPAGNQTRVSSVAGTYTITVLPAPKYSHRDLNTGFLAC